MGRRRRPAPPWSFSLRTLLALLIAFVVLSCKADTTTTPSASVKGGVVSIVDEGAEVAEATISPAPVSVLESLVGGAPDAPAMAFDRYQLVASYEFNTAAAMGTILGTHDFPDLLNATPYVANRLSYYRFQRTGAKIKVTADGNRFLYGSVIVGVDQSSTLLNATTGGTLDGVCHVAGLPHCIVDVNTGEGEELSLPWLSPSPALDLMSTTEPAKLGRVFVQVMGPLTPVSASAVAGGVTVNVYARLVDMVLDGPIGEPDTVALRAHKAPMVPQMRRGAGAGAGAGATSEAKEKSFRGLVEGASSFVARAAKDILPEPIMSGLSMLGSWFGYDFPRSVAAPTSVLRRMAPGFGSAEGLDPSSLLSAYVGTKPFVLKGFGQVNADEMSLRVMAGTPSILATFQILESHAPGTVLWNTPVNPHVMQQSNAPLADLPSFIPTFAAAASIPFTYWRSSICYMLYVSCSTSHSARIRFTFQPMDDGTGASWDKKQAITAVHQISGPAIIPFTVPFVFPQAWAIESIGQLYVTVESQLSPIGDVVSAPIQVFVYVSCGDDFQVAELSGTYLCSQVCQVYPVEDGREDPDMLGAGAGATRPQFKPHDEVSAAVSAGNTAGYSATKLSRDGTFLPDMHENWATALRVPELWIGSQPWLGTPASATDPRILSFLDAQPRGYQVFSAIELTGPPPWGPAPTGLAGGFIPTTTLPSAGLISWATPVGKAAPGSAYNGRGYIYWTLADHVAQFYRFQTGGVRLKGIMEDTNTTMRSPGHVILKRVPAGSTYGILSSATELYPPFVTPPSVSVSEGPAGPSVGPMVIESSSLGSGSILEVEIPRSAKTLFSDTRCTDSFSAASTATIGTKTRRNYTGDNMGLVVIEQEYGAKLRALYRCMAEDKQFMGLQLPFGVAVVRTIRFGYFFEPSMVYASVSTMQTTWTGVILA